MCIRRETREKARRSLAFSRVSKPHTHITHMLRQCTSIVYILIAKNLLTGSLKNISINNLETQKKSISMKNSQFFDYLLYAKSK